MNKGLFPRLAAQNMRKNRRFFLPYLLALMGLAAAFYVMAALCMDPGTVQMRGYEYVQAMMGIGMVVAGSFSIVLLLYINSFLMKQRKKELGLYNILGMGKGAIALIQCWESLYTAVIGIGGGIIAGLALHLLAASLLARVIPAGVVFSARPSLPAAVLTAAVFCAMLALTLVINLIRVRLSRPIELLRAGNTGEREPKTRWLPAVIGIAALAAGYAIAITTTDPISALALYFLAVVLVIIGTYCLFTAVSIAVLKLLRRNKRFYYQTSHFIGVSGMLYRMKRNAVGLANICILSTMVMVMISGTLSLYLGIGEIIETQYPANLQMEVRYGEDQEVPFDRQAAAALSARFAEEQGIPVTGVRTCRYLSFYVSSTDGGWLLATSSDTTLNRAAYFLTRADYAALTGQEAPALSPGEMAVCGAGTAGPVTFQTVTNETLDYTIVHTLPDIPYFSATFDKFATVCFVAADDAALSELYRFQADSCYNDYRFLIFLDLDCTSEEELELASAWCDAAMDANFFTGTGSWNSWSATVRSEMSVDGYAMSGSFLFLGLALGILFLMATALIIYYKQVSEGYEDQSRFEIMRKVGLSRTQVRAAVRAQVLMVFFLPLLVAAVHILFDFNLVVQLLSLFAVRSVPTIALCTAGTLLMFLAVYAVVYLLTARTYYKIVDRS